MAKNNETGNAVCEHYYSAEILTDLMSSFIPVDFIRLCGWKYVVVVLLVILQQDTDSKHRSKAFFFFLLKSCILHLLRFF